MATVKRTFFSVIVRCGFTTSYPKNFKLTLSDGRIEEIEFSPGNVRDIENYLMLDSENSVYFSDVECLVMVGKNKIHCEGGRKARRFLAVMSGPGKLAKSGIDNNTVIYRSTTQVERFVRMQDVENPSPEFEEFAFLSREEEQEVYEEARKRREENDKKKKAGGGDSSPI